MPAVGKLDTTIAKAGDLLDLEASAVMVARHYASAGGSEVDGKMGFASVFHNGNDLKVWIQGEFSR